MGFGGEKCLILGQTNHVKTLWRQIITGYKQKMKYCTSIRFIEVIMDC